MPIDPLPVDAPQHLSSCFSKAPMMTLAEDGNAPTLKYNIPQSTCYQFYGHILCDVANTYFKENTFQKPANNFYDRTEPFTADQLASMLQVSNGLINNASVLRPQDVKQPQVVNELKTMGGGGSTNQNPIEPTVCGIPYSHIAEKINEGYQPYITDGMNGTNTTLTFIPEPKNPKPTLFIIEEYHVCSFLGDYGAGKTIKTFSLLPGEKTTITVRTYKEINTTTSSSQNVLDSFSEESAKEMENTIEKESSLESIDSEEVKKNVRVSASLSATVWKVTAKVEGGFSKDTNTNATRSSSANSLSRAVGKSVAKSNANREVSVNTSSQEARKEGEETTIVRTLENFNKSRTLNFVFRQLNQAYDTVTYLHSIRIGYTNGYIDGTRIVELEEIDSLLADVINAPDISTVRNILLKPYCAVFNYERQPKQFIKKFTANLDDCLGTGSNDVLEMYIKNPELTDTAGPVTIKGVILNVQQEILRTDSLIVDAILGQGDALDCFNLRIQDAEAERAYLQNAQMQVDMNLKQDEMALKQAAQEMENYVKEKEIELRIEMYNLQKDIIQSVDPEVQIEKFKKVFTNCCEVPQSGCCCAKCTETIN